MMRFHRVKIVLRDFVYDFSDKFPNLGIPLSKGWNLLIKFKFLLKKIIQEARRQLKYSSSIFALEKVIWMNPHKIDFYLINNSITSSKSSLELKGDWDLSKELIKNSLIYKTFKCKFIDRKNWEEIKYYNLILIQISKGIIKWGCNNKRELDNKLREIESLYYQIKKNADNFKDNLIIKKDNEILEKLDRFEKIVVAIDRNGQFIVFKGMNNLLIAKFLNIPKIPVHINIRHKAWIDFKKKLYYFSNNYRKRELYQQVTHPDLQTIPFSRTDTRFNIIKENLSTFQGTLLDIGANLGYFCRKFEDEGFDCYAVEVNKLYGYFLTKLKKAENKKYKIIPKSIFNYNKNQELRFDIVLALNIFHHFLKRRNTYLNLINLLKRLKVKELFFGAHNPNDYRNSKVYINFNPEQFVNFILENSCLNKAYLLANINGGRTLYKLTT